MVTLQNGLTALLVSDSKADKAAVAMSVGIGHLSDPVSQEVNEVQLAEVLADSVDCSATAGRSTGVSSALSSPPFSSTQAPSLPALSSLLLLSTHAGARLVGRAERNLANLELPFLPLPSRRRLAHFCEHMLFLGTSLFPEEASYKNFLSQNSGSSNAFTSLAETNFYLDVSPAALPEALERHGQFFTAPLFDQSCTEREVNAVNSEQSRNLQLDNRRLFQLGKATSHRGEGSVYWKFGTGNKETLWEKPGKRGVDGECVLGGAAARRCFTDLRLAVRDRLLDWYSKHYSANLMNLVVLGSRRSLSTSLAAGLGADLTAFAAQRASMTSPPSQSSTTPIYPTLTCRRTSLMRQFSRRRSST